MPHLLAAAGVLVATAGAVSLLMLLPAVALAETFGEGKAARRAQVWLAASLIPPAAGLCAALAALWIHAQGIGASPHLGGQRPHLCLLPLLRAPGGAYRLELFTWIALGLTAFAVLRLMGGAVASHLLRRLVTTAGAPVAGGPPGCDLYLVQLSRPTSFNAGLLRPVVVTSTLLRDSLTDEAYDAVIAHERVHCARRDNLRGLVVDACTALLLPLPTVHHYRRQWRAAAEAAADDGALQLGATVEALLVALQALRRSASRPASAPSLASLLIPETPITDQRLARLRLAPADEHKPGMRDSMVLPGVVAAAVFLVVLLLLASTRSLQDTLFCAAEQLIRAAR